MVKITRLYWFICASLLILILDFLGGLSPIKKHLDQFIIPIKKVVYAKTSSFKNLLDDFWQYPNLKQVMEDKEKLKKKEAELNFKVAELISENKKLRAQLEAPLPPSYKFIPAQVIAVSRFMEIDVGENLSVRVGMVVVDEQSLVGRIVTVGALRSKVILPSDPESVVPAVTNRGAKGEITGQAGKTVNFDKVLQKESLFLGDMIVTSGEGGFPPNFLIGKITYINTDETSAYKKAQVAPVIQYDKEKLVFVITNY